MFSRIRQWYAELGYRTFMFTASAYITAASLIGFETAAFILGYVTIWPIGAPLLLIGIAGWVLVRRMLGRGTPSDDESDD
ncbi:hypothetical protein BH10ACT7_BH10ACT7_16170 [soil metagenome]